MHGKTVLKVVLILLAVFAAFVGYQEFQKYRAIKTLTIDTILECKENLLFLYNCDALIRKTGNETEGMIKAQWEIQHWLQTRDMLALRKAGITGKKKEAVNRLLDDINIYNTCLAYAFNAGVGAHGQAPERTISTGDMIKEFEELEKMLKE